MVLPAFILDWDTGETIARFGYEVDVPRGAEVPWLPQRWCRARRYTIPAVGPGGHAWGHWCGALLILGAVAGVLGHAL